MSQGPYLDLHAVFPGESELAELMRRFEWAQSSLGPVDRWPQTLRTAVRIMLTSRFAMWMGWGPDLTFLYNDAYSRMTLGKKHPWALGRPSRLVWQEIWGDIGPRIQRVLDSGVATWDEKLLLFLQRSGYPEETYHTFSYSPLSDDDGRIAGHLCVVTEETERVIGERRLGSLRHLAEQLTATATEAEVLQAAERALGLNDRDLPFTLIYLFVGDTDVARLAASTGVTGERRAALEQDADSWSESRWPLEAMRNMGKPVVVSDLPTRLAGLSPVPSGAWDKAPSSAVLVPIARQGHEGLAGFLVGGINPYRPFDTEYAGFMELAAGQIAAGLANARAYEAEKRRAESLAELDRAKTAFFSNVSHEFRTPLTLMLGPLEDALREPRTPHDLSRLTVIHRNGLRLLRLVNTLLDFSRIEAGRVQASYEPTNLGEFTADLASVFRAAVERAGLKFVVDCDAGGRSAFVDRDMWEKIVFNLLSNAFKYTLSGEIAVRLRADERRFELEVRDTGTGIPEHELPHIFERFHRVEGARGRTHEGTGIGLALVSELVKLHAGRVDVQSIIDRGSTFTVVIPAGSAHLSADRIRAPRTTPSTALGAVPFLEEALRWLPGAGEPLHEVQTLLPSTAVTAAPADAGDLPFIVVADDNADMRDYVSRLLSARYRVRAVADGEAALAAIRTERPALVLSDVMMPRLDGFALLKTIRDSPDLRTLPVILLSARAGEEARVEGLGAGADDYLIKPFSAHELVARVGATIQLAQVRDDSEREIRRLNDALNAQVHDYEALLKKLEQSQEELQQKVTDLEAFHDVTVGRELRMMELERKLAELERGQDYGRRTVPSAEDKEGRS